MTMKLRIAIPIASSPLKVDHIRTMSVAADDSGYASAAFTRAVSTRAYTSVLVIDRWQRAAWTTPRSPVAR
jgi:hypothetical protein